MAEQTDPFEKLLSLKSPRPQKPPAIKIDTNDNTNNNNNDNDIKQSDHTGLLFPSGRVWNSMGDKIVNDTTNDFQSISPDAAVYLSAVLEHMTKELLELAGNAAKRSNKTRIEPPDIRKAVRHDQEFGLFFGLLYKSYIVTNHFI